MLFAFPLYLTQASREFSTFLLMMRHACATYPVPWAVLRAGVIDVIMRAHGVIENAKAQIITQRGLSPLCIYCAEGRR